MRWLSLVLVASLLAVPAAAIADDRENLLKENRVIELELELSKQSKPYFIFNLEAGHILLRIKGITLRTFPIKAYHFWGTPLVVRPLAMTAKTALTAPSRPLLKPEPEAPPSSGAPPVKPAENQPAAPKPPDDLVALELKDMPTEYTLEVEGGTSIFIKNRAAGFRAWLSNLRHDLKWRLSAPLATLRHALRHEPYTTLRLVLEEQDARALYWAMPEGTQIILR
jgi:hypothetical protein